MDDSYLREILANTPVNAQNAGLVSQLMQVMHDENFYLQEYTYSIPFVAAGAANAIGAGAQVNGSVTIQTDAPFCIINQTYSANALNAGTTKANQVVPNCSILLTDTGSGANLMDKAVAVTSIFGTGELPFAVPMPRVFTTNATLQATVTNLDPANGLNLMLSFNGVKILRKG